MPKRPATSIRLVRAILALGAVAFLTFPFNVPALADSDGDAYDVVDTFEQFERTDAAEFSDLIEQAKTCITDWDFACAKEKLEGARLAITKKGDNAILASLENLMAFEKLLAKSHECAKAWNFDCAVEKVKEAKSYAEANLDSLYLDVPALEQRLEAAVDYIEEQHSLWEVAGKQNPDIVLVDSFKASRGQVVRAEVWVAGEKVMSPEILIEWYNPSISGYEIALYDSGPFAKLLCSLYVFGSGYYTNDLHCAGVRIGRTEGYDAFNYPLDRLVRDIVMYYYQTHY